MDESFDYPSFDSLLSIVIGHQRSRARKRKGTTHANLENGHGPRHCPGMSGEGQGGVAERGVDQRLNRRVNDKKVRYIC